MKHQYVAPGRVQMVLHHQEPMAYQNNHVRAIFASTLACFLTFDITISNGKGLNSVFKENLQNTLASEHGIKKFKSQDLGVYFFPF